MLNVKYITTIQFVNVNMVLKAIRTNIASSQNNVSIIFIYNFFVCVMNNHDRPSICYLTRKHDDNNDYDTLSRYYFAGFNSSFFIFIQKVFDK